MSVAASPISTDPTAQGRPSRIPRWLPHLLLLGVLALAFLWGRQLMAPGLTGLYNDDAGYVDTAKAIAQGHGYSIMWVPKHGPMPADRFPIGFPALLALIVRFVPPPVERQVFAMQWGVDALAVAFLAVSYCFVVRRLKISPWIALVCVSLIAVNPMFGDLSSCVMSDLPFALVFVVAWWLHDRMVKRPGALDVAGAAVTMAAALLIRYAAAIMPLVTFYVLLRRGRAKAALGYGVTLAALLTPWLYWVVSHHLAGYAHQWGHQLLAPRAMFFNTLAFSALYMAYLGLAALVFPQIFLGKYPWRTPLAFGNPAYMAIGAAATMAILAALAATWWIGRRPAIEEDEKAASSRSFAALVVLSYLALLVVWCSGFLYLGEFLTVRLLMPVAPVALALTVHLAARAIRSWRPAFMVLGAMLIATFLALGIGGALRIHPGAVKENKVRDLGLAQFVALVKEFKKQVPATMMVATDREPEYYLYTGRKCYSLSLNLNLVIPEIEHLPIRFLIVPPNPTAASPKDLTTKLIRGLNKRFPKLVWTIYDSANQPIGVYRLDRSKLPKLPKLPKTPKAPGASRASKPPR